MPNSAVIRFVLVAGMVAAALLAWWPWNLLILIGAANAWRLQCGNFRRLLTSRQSNLLVGRAQSLEHPLILCDDLHPAHEFRRIVGYQQLGDVP